MLKIRLYNFVVMVAMTTMRCEFQSKSNGIDVTEETVVFVGVCVCVQKYSIRLSFSEKPLQTTKKKLSIKAGVTFLQQHP